MHYRYNESTADLKELMTTAPISPEAHAALLRGKVDTRRLLEDAREEARQRSEEVLQPRLHHGKDFADLTRPGETP